jgi:chromosome segregation ATPase
LESTLRQLNLQQEKYEAEINFLNVENKDLKERLLLGERDQAVEIEALRRKYTSLHLDDSEALRSTHTQEVRFLLEEIDKLRASLGDKATELQLQFQDRREQQERFDQELLSKNNEIANLKNQLMIQ